MFIARMQIRDQSQKYKHTGKKQNKIGLLLHLRQAQCILAVWIAI